MAPKREICLHRLFYNFSELDQPSEHQPVPLRAADMRPPVVYDRLLLTGEVSSILSGELASKVYLTITRQDWTLASERLAKNPLTNQYFLSISDDALNRLWFDGSLLISAWFIANIISSDGVLGFMPRNMKVFTNAPHTTRTTPHSASRPDTTRQYHCLSRQRTSSWPLCSSCASQSTGTEARRSKFTVLALNSCRLIFGISLAQKITRCSLRSPLPFSSHSD